MTDENQPLLPELLKQVHGQLARVFDELVDVHRAYVSDRGVRLAGAALVPVHDRERPLEVSRDAAVRRQLGRARATVEVEHDRIGEILGALENPLINSTDADAFERVGLHFLLARAATAPTG